MIQIRCYGRAKQVKTVGGSNRRGAPMVVLNSNKELELIVGKRIRNK
jgi:hypothetical protein